MMNSISSYDHKVAKQIMATFHISWPSAASGSAHACKLFHIDHIWIDCLGEREPRALFVFNFFFNKMII